MEKPVLLDNEQAAEFLGVTPATLTTWRCTQHYVIPFVKYGDGRRGGKVLYEEADLIKFIQSRKVTR